MSELGSSKKEVQRPEQGDSINSGGGQVSTDIKCKACGEYNLEEAFSCYSCGSALVSPDRSANAQEQIDDLLLEHINSQMNNPDPTVQVEQIDSEGQGGEEQKFKFCISCGAKILEISKFCNKCGVVQPIGDTVSTASNKTTEIPKSASVCIECRQPIPVGSNSTRCPRCQQAGKELAYKELFIGGNSYYYLSRWKALEDKQSAFNWSAFWGGLIWMAYRKMYAYAFGILTIIIIIGFALPDNFSRVMGMVLGLTLGRSGNYLYSIYAKKKIDSLKSVHKNENLLKLEIAKQGGTSVMAAIGIGLFEVIGVALQIFSSNS